jgi:hypothetical protein
VPLWFFIKQLAGVCNNENEYTYAGGIAAKWFVVVTDKHKLNDNVRMATLSGGFGGGGSS